MRPDDTAPSARPRVGGGVATSHGARHATATPDTPSPNADRTLVSLNPAHDLPVRLQLPPERPTGEARAAGDLGERTVPTAVRLLGLVHGDGHVYEITALLRALRGVELEALAVTLAAMVDPDRTPAELLAWVTWDEEGNPLPDGAALPAKPTPRDRWTQPCGTHAAHERHRARGERPCDECVAAEREYQQQRHQRRERRTA